MFSSSKDHSNNIQVSLETGSCCLTSPEKLRGEDVEIVRTSHGVTILGVLDGVGGWAEHGVDPSAYPRKLAENIIGEFMVWAEKDALGSSTSGFFKKNRPLTDILTRAFNTTQKFRLRGSTTVCLGMLCPSGQLHVLNLGDSALKVISGGHQVFSTKVQQAAFNTPKQLGHLAGVSPKEGSYDKLSVQRGDLILLASDGLWDNMWEEEWLNEVRGAAVGAGSMERLASSLGRRAQGHGADCSFDSPFAAQAGAQGGGCRGGKLDDTTVVVGRVA